MNSGVRGQVKNKVKKVKKHAIAHFFTVIKFVQSKKFIIKIGFKMF